MLSAINKAAAQRLLPFATKIESLKVMRNGAVQVTYFCGTRRCSTFVSRKAFERDFIEFRQLGAHAVSVKRWPAGSYENHYDCWTEGSARRHTTKLLGSIAICSCEDYAHQQKYGVGRHCKHIVATLNYLGFDSMPDYLKARSRQVDIEEREALLSLGF